MAKETKIVMNNFNSYYGDFHAIKDINMEIKENEITAFIGPSGCGKSTLLRSINRMNDLIEGFRREGDMFLDGDHIWDDMDVYELRTRVGMVFQQPNPFAKSIFDNVAYGPRTHGISNKEELQEIVETALKQAAIWEEVKDKLHQNATEISGGQQQRICIARTLAVKPEVVLLDEPTSALDPISTTAIEDLLLHLKEEYTIVIVTHNMQQASRISDKTAFMYLGELEEFANTEKIFSNPDSERTERYITGRFG